MKKYIFLLILIIMFVVVNITGCQNQNDNSLKNKSNNEEINEQIKLIKNKGIELIKQDKLTEGINVLLSIKNKDEETEKYLIDAYYERGEYFYNIGDYKSAIADFKIIKNQNDKVPEMLYKSYEKDLYNILNYTFIDEIKIHSKKSTINIRIFKESKFDILYNFTKFLYEYFYNDKELIKVFFYLPEMQVGNGAYAMSETDGKNIDVKIYGYTTDKINELSSILQDENIIGIWKYNLFGGSLIYLRKDNSNYTLLRFFNDGSKLEKKVIINKVNNQIEIREIETNHFGQYYKVLLNGDLEIWDNEGYINTATAIKTITY